MSASSLVLAGLAVSSAPAAASVDSDQKSVTQIEQQIAADGEHAQSLVSQFNQVQERVNALDAQIAHDQRIVAADQASEAASTDTLRRLAVKAYVTDGGMDAPPLELFDGTTNITAALERNQYLGTLGAKFDAALTAVQLDRARTQDAQRSLQGEHEQATKSLAQLTSAHDAANAAITADEANLSRVKGNIRSVLAAANAKRHEEQEAAERALAAAPTAAASPAVAPDPDRSIETTPPTTSPAPTSPTTSPPNGPPPSSPNPPPSPGQYANPLRSITALNPERIDQGVDYGGFGPIYAIGDGVVLMTVGSGWPGGTFIAYRLTDGPANGLVVFAAEDIEPSVNVGDAVTSNTVLGRMFAGPDGIETGWADGSRLPDTMARTYRQFNGSNSTAFGYNFSQLLQSLGAPGGIPSGPPSGAVPASWPKW